MAIDKLSKAEQKQVVGNHVAGKTDTILFDIPGGGLHVIQPRSALDAITNPVVIDGYSQLGSKTNTKFLSEGDNAKLEIELDGSSAGNASGLTLHATNSTVKGLVINRFNGAEILVQGGGSNTISGDFFGILPDGTTAAGGGWDVIVDNSAGNTIGGTDASARNIISASSVSTIAGSVSGIRLTGAKTQDNNVQGNYIGTDRTGNRELPNSVNGIEISAGAGANLIGGPAAGANNLISGNEGSGIIIESGSNAVQTNLIGTNAAGNAKLPNGFNGVYIYGSSDNRIVDHNVISGNDGNGVFIFGGDGNAIQGNYIGLDFGGNRAIPNGKVAGPNQHNSGVLIEKGNGNLVGGMEDADRNIISGNTGYGVLIRNRSTTNAVQGNFIGTDNTGNRATDFLGNSIGNSLGGVGIAGGARNNSIGFETATLGQAPGNVIAANRGNGVSISSPGNSIEGNFIGVAFNGTALGNTGDGVRVNEVSAQIGGDIAEEGNVVSGNGGDGVLLVNCASVEIMSNLIGVSPDGSARMGNANNGINLVGGSDIVIGGPASPTGHAPGNVISGNGSPAAQKNNANGIRIRGSRNSRIEGNLIGTDKKGTTAVPNEGSGIFLEGVFAGILIGGNNPNQGNVISGNKIYGIDGTFNRATMRNNKIGEDINGKPKLPNGKAPSRASGNNNLFKNNAFAGGQGASVEWVLGTGNQFIDNLVELANGNGLQLDVGATGNLLSGNTFTLNTGAGIRDENKPLSNTFTQNSIYDNGALGIDDGPLGVTTTSIPLFTGAQVVAGQLVLTGTLNNPPPNTRFRIEFFDNQQPDPSGFGEGQTYLGSTTVTSDGAGQTTYTVAFPLSAITGGFITATATDASGTSEFSTWITAYQITPFSGTPQDTPVSTSFADPLEAIVTNAGGQALQGAIVTFTAPLTGAGGTFVGGFTSVQEITDSNGIATAPAFTANGQTGSYVVTASIQGVSTTADFDLTNDSAGNLTIAPTTVALTLTTTSTTVGSGIPLAASATLSGGDNPTGTITFTLDDPSGNLVYTDVVTVTGDGTYTTDMGNNPGGYLPIDPGTYNWFAFYSGTGNHSTPQETTITTGFNNPLEATVTDANGNPVPNALVLFAAPSFGPGGTFAGGLTSVEETTDSNGVAVAPAFTANGLAGSYQVAAFVAGGNAPAIFALTNDPAQTTSTLTADPNPSAPGGPVTFTGIVSSLQGDPTGSVGFYDGTTLLGFGTLAVVNGIDEATFTTSTLAPGEHFINTLYAGDGNFSASASPTLLQAVGNPTVTGLITFNNPSVTGGSVTLVANVQALNTFTPVTSGVVDFFEVMADGSSVLLGTSGLDQNGIAQLTVDSLLPPGNEIIATFMASGIYESSTSPPLLEVVNPADTNVSLTDSSPTVVAGQMDSLTVSLGTQPPGSFVVPPTGTVNLYSSFDGGPATLLLQIPVGSSGNFPGLTAPGTYVFYVIYSGDAHFNGSTSNSITIAVTGTTTTMGTPWSLTDPVSSPHHGKQGRHDDRDAFFAYYEEWMHVHRAG